MWSVEFDNSAVEKEVAALIKSKKLTAEDQAITHAWFNKPLLMVLNQFVEELFIGLLIKKL